MDNSTTTTLIAVAASAATACAVAWVLQSSRRRNDPKNTTDRKSSNSSTSAPLKTNQRTTTQQPLPNDDVWAERRRRGIAAASSHIKTDASASQPFGSSYYYAHNNSRTTGGYKDGLTMEDFTMNGPRLLRRGGKPVVEEQTMENSSSNNNSSEMKEEPHDETTNPSSSHPRESKPRRQLNISKYLWDDPGDTSYKATIRIDSLPALNGSSTMVPWSEVRPTIQSIAVNHTATNGMELCITTTTTGSFATAEYTLRIPEFYDAVASVEAISKAKRLLIRVHKARKGRWNVLASSSTTSWPHPHKKLS